MSLINIFDLSKNVFENGMDLSISLVVNEVNVAVRVYLIYFHGKARNTFYDPSKNAKIYIVRSESTIDDTREIDTI